MQVEEEKGKGQEQDESAKSDAEQGQQIANFLDSDGDAGSFRLCADPVNPAEKLLQLWYTLQARSAQQLQQPNLSIVVYDSESGEVSVGSEGSLQGGSFKVREHAAVMQKVERMCRVVRARFVDKVKQRERQSQQGFGRKRSELEMLLEEETLTMLANSSSAKEGDEANTPGSAKRRRQ